MTYRLSPMFPTLLLLVSGCSGGSPGGSNDELSSEPNPESADEGHPNDDAPPEVQEEEMGNDDACPPPSDDSSIWGPGCVTLDRALASNLEIAPGTTVRIKRGGYLHILGTLTAVGTEEEPIIFESAEQEPLPGDWGCVVFSGTEESEIAHWIVRDAGGLCTPTRAKSQGALILEGSPRRFEHVRVEESQASGLVMTEDAYNIRQFSNVSFENIEGHSISAMPAAIEGLGAPIQLDSDDRYIEVDATGIIDLDQPALWKNIGIPYGVAGPFNSSSPLTIEPGTVIMAHESFRFTLDAHLIAEGTKDKPIVWTSIEEHPKAGDWGCILLWDTYRPSVLEHNRFEYAGDGGKCPEATALRLLRADAELSDLAFHNISGAAIVDSDCGSVEEGNWCDFEFNNVQEDVVCSYKNTAICEF